MNTNNDFAFTLEGRLYKVKDGVASEVADRAALDVPMWQDKVKAELADIERIIKDGKSRQANLFANGVALGCGIGFLIGAVAGFMMK